MTPIEFITKAQQSGGHDVEDVNEAFQQPLIIMSNSHEWEILSYYFAPETGQMTIDIQKKGGKKRRKT